MHWISLHITQRIGLFDFTDIWHPSFICFAGHNLETRLSTPNCCKVTNSQNSPFLTHFVQWHATTFDSVLASLPPRLRLRTSSLGMPKCDPKSAYALADPGPPPSVWFLGPTQVHSLKGTSIGSAILFLQGLDLRFWFAEKHRDTETHATSLRWPGPRFLAKRAPHYFVSLTLTAMKAWRWIEPHRTRPLTGWQHQSMTGVEAYQSSTSDSKLLAKGLHNVFSLPSNGVTQSLVTYGPAYYIYRNCSFPQTQCKFNV